MADTVTSTVLENGPKWYKIHLMNQSDGTGESAVTKIDLSAITGNLADKTLQSLSLIEVAGSVSSGYVQLLWDATTDDEMYNCIGDFSIYFDGGLHDPKSTGYTGDVKLTTSGFASGDSYDITLLFRKKYA